jgi:hypothetical protein
MPVAVIHPAVLEAAARERQVPFTAAVAAVGTPSIHGHTRCLRNQKTAAAAVEMAVAVKGAVTSGWHRLAS